MKVKSSIERGAEYLCTKLGDVVTAIEQVAVVKGLAMWEVERRIGSGISLESGVTVSRYSTMTRESNSALPSSINSTGTFPSGLLSAT